MAVDATQKTELHCECCGGPLRELLYFHDRLWYRCQDCGHDQENQPNERRRK
jgi:uncharacterized Zn finger protein